MPAFAKRGGILGGAVADELALALAAEILGLVDEQGKTEPVGRLDGERQGVIRRRRGGSIASNRGRACAPGRGGASLSLRMRGSNIPR